MTYKYSSLFLVFILLLVGCRSEGVRETAVTLPASPAGTNDKPTIALVLKTLTNPFFVEMEKGARRAEDELDIELIVKTAAQETSIEQQIEIVERLIRDQVDAIVIAPGDSLELIPVLKKAQDAGIVVINIDNRLDQDYSEKLGLVNVPFISVNNEQAAYLSAKFISDQITTPTQAIIIEGIRSAKNAEDRKNGALLAFAENPNIEVVAQETANWKIDESYNVTQALYDQFPDIGAIFAANDMMALGAIKYLEESGHETILVAAFDALAEAQDALESGHLAVTVDQKAAEQGYLGVKYALQALEGETPPLETYIDVTLITSENLE